MLLKSVHLLLLSLLIPRLLHHCISVLNHFLISHFSFQLTTLYGWLARLTAIFQKRRERIGIYFGKWKDNVAGHMNATGSGIPWPSGQNFCYIFWKARVEISTRRPAVLIRLYFYVGHLAFSPILCSIPTLIQICHISRELVKTSLYIYKEISTDFLGTPFKTLSLRRTY